MRFFLFYLCRNRLFFWFCRECKDFSAVNLTLDYFGFFLLLLWQIVVFVFMFVQDDVNFPFPVAFHQVYLSVVFFEGCGLVEMSDGCGPT